MAKDEPTGIVPEQPPPLPRPTPPTEITARCLALRSGWEALQALGASRRIALVADWTTRWQAPKDPFRMEALDLLPSRLGISRKNLEVGLDLLFCQWNREVMERLYQDELGHMGIQESGCQNRGGEIRVTAPGLVVHILAGNVPPPTVQALIPSLILGAPCLLKPAASDTVFAEVLVRSLVARSPGFEEAAAVCYWPGGDLQAEAAAFENADVVVATGSDETLQALRERIPSHVRFVGRGHRISIGYFTDKALKSAHADDIAEGLGRDIALFDQQGCLSPQLLLIETDSPEAVRKFGRILMGVASSRVLEELPRGRTDLGQAGRVMHFLGTEEMRREVHRSRGLDLVIDDGDKASPSCLGRVLWVKRVENVSEGAVYLEPLLPFLQGVALAAAPDEWPSRAAFFARLGASRVCRPGNLQAPPARWPPDGRPVLADLVRWTILEP